MSCEHLVMRLDYSNVNNEEGNGGVQKYHVYERYFFSTLVVIQYPATRYQIIVYCVKNGPRTVHSLLSMTWKKRFLTVWPLCWASITIRKVPTVVSMCRAVTRRTKFTRIADIVSLHIDTVRRTSINKIPPITGHTFDKISTISGSIVYAWKDILIGYQAQYDSSKNKMTKNDLALEFGSDDIRLHARCNNIPYECGLSIYCKVNDQWEAVLDGVSAKNDSVNLWTLGIGAKYILQENSTVRCKFNKDLQLGTSLRQQLYEGIALTLSFNVDLKKIKTGGHKVGLSLDLEA
ncbi:voltage-dependent anion-selective channel protein 2 isoform X1 [Cephus cinctus]|uniref:Voltage-dependent anion-selective channel protein 2 isoform X1 n=1 Tax=Cephus cinctus TaxID=211228 RepID=A0AAJ7RK63_CEPCN|nr:voltage-dependent anion-selective channel protein 2 isoform X1 [Cephus cinctus]